MSEQQQFSDLFITSAIITGPIVQNMLFGPCVNEEFSNISLKKDMLQFDNDSNIEERKEPYSDEELNDIYNNSRVQEEEYNYYERTSNIQMQKEIEQFWENMYLEDLEYQRFLEEEEKKERRLEYYMSRNK
jgi:hypothetical protein